MATPSRAGRARTRPAARPPDPGPDGGPQRPLVLVAHEPLAYREALAGALRALRPRVEVAVVAPADLDDEIERRRPDAVFSSRPSRVVQARARAWALLYPGGERVVETYVAGERALAADLSLDAALALVDRVAEPARVR